MKSTAGASAKRLRNSLCKDKSQTQEKSKVREVSSSESSEDDQISCQNDGNEVGYLLKNTGKKSGPINKKLSELINTLWQQKEPLYKLKDKRSTYDTPKNCQKLAIKYCNEEIWTGHLQNKHRNVDLKTQKVQKTINKAGMILGQVADSLIKIKHSRNMTASDKRNAVMPLIQMCTDGLTFLAHGNKLLNQTCRNYITSVLPRHMSEHGKKVPQDSDWLFGDNSFQNKPD